MKKAVAFSCPTLPCNSGLVRNTSKKNIKMILESVNMLSVHCPDTFRQEVEDEGPPDPQGVLLCISDWCRRLPVHCFWDYHPSPPVATRGEVEVITSDHTLTDFPDKNQLIPLSPTLLRVEVELS